MSIRTVRLLCIYGVLSIVANFPSGFTNSTVNTAVEQLHQFIVKSYRKRGYDLTEATIALVQSATLNCWFVTQIFGSMFTPFITDTYGRKFGYIFSQVVTILATLVQYFSVVFHLPEGLIFGRSLTALVSPLGDACLLLYVQETSPIHIRGMSSFLCEIGYGSMCVLGMILGLKSVLGYSLAHLLLVSLIPEVACLLFIFLIPETPKNDRSRALKSVEFFQGVKAENERVLVEYEREKIQETSSKKSSFRDVFVSWHVRQAILLSCAALVLTLPFYPILQSSTYIFNQSGIPLNVAAASSTVLMGVFTLCSVIGAFFIDHYPRRFLILLFGIIATISLLLFSCFSLFKVGHRWSRFGCLGAIVGYCISFGMVLGPISWFVAPELVSQRHKSTVFSLCFAIHNVLISLTDFATVPLFRLIGGVCFLPLFVVPMSFCLYYLYRYLPESLGKETHEIVSEMLEKSNRGIEDCNTPSFVVTPHFSILNNQAAASAPVLAVRHSPSPLLPSSRRTPSGNSPSPPTFSASPSTSGTSNPIISRFRHLYGDGSTSFHH
ncbi:hypothetical protein WR25_15911 [Diploscapter pachys]|uniref:Major facilitator superfamily (MFS) profile domain-containing protein n=1 Tax=Diploscapter pachys TaxID=2018661 RepID=A0A2A2J3C7_9BILA|nr:hypothetical protein WR25_15911 [Diploscapter pachys]